MRHHQVSSVPFITAVLLGPAICRADGTTADGSSQAPEQFMELLRHQITSWFDLVRTGLPHALIKAAIFILILVIFWILAKMAQWFVGRILRSRKYQVSELLRRAVVGAAGNLVLLVGLMVALSQIGVKVGPILAGLGVAGIVIGFALQDTLSNFAAGAMILLYQPFDIGDLIEVGSAFGTVEGMNIVTTTIHTLDNQTLVVPNSKIWGDVIRNMTAQDVRRVDLMFGVSYSDDIEKVERVLGEIVASNPKVLAEPAPVIRLHELADSSINFVVRPWVKTSDYWDVYWSITREVKRRFDAEGISIPFPQHDVHLFNEDGS